MNDRSVVEGFLAGDQGSVELVRRWIRSSLSRYHDLDDPEDIEQELLLSLLRSFEHIDPSPDRPLRAYVQAAAHHKCIDQLRLRSRREMVGVHVVDLVSESPSAIEDFSAKESTLLALRVLSEMPEGCRILWRYLEAGLSYREISGREGVAEGALRARALRCRRKAIAMRLQILSKMRRNKTLAASND